MLEADYLTAHLPEQAAVLQAARDRLDAARAAAYSAQQAFRAADEAVTAAKKAATAAAVVHFAEHQRPANAVPPEIIQRIADQGGVPWRKPKRLVGWSAGRQVLEDGDLFAVLFKAEAGAEWGALSRARPIASIEPMNVGTGRGGFLGWVNAGQPRSIYLDTGTVVGSGQRKRRISPEDCEAIARIVGLTIANRSGTQEQELERGEGGD